MKILKLVFTILLVSVIAISCSKMEEIEEAPCGAHGIPVIDSDECFCDLYYEGDNCEIEIREKFIGEWIAYDHSCSFGDSFPDGFTVVISKVDEVSEVKIVAPELLPDETIISSVDFIGYLRYQEFELLGTTKIKNTFGIEIFHDRDTDILRVFISRNEDLDEFVEHCNCILKRE